MTTTLFRGAHIIAAPRSGDHGSVQSILVEDRKIAALGEEAEARAGKAAEVRDMAGQIAIPGMVNAHMHSWQTGLRGIALDWTLMEYLGSVHARVMPVLTPDDVYIGTLAAALNQIEAGVSTLCDWCHANRSPEHTDAALSALQESGIRARFLHAVPMGQGHSRETVKALLAHDALAGSDRLSLGLAIAGPLYCAPAVAEADLALARDLDLVATMHHSGPPQVADEVWYDLIDKGLFGPKVNIVHANMMSDELMKRLVDTGTTFTMTPEVEMSDGHGHPITGRLRALGVVPSIGIDIECATGSSPVVAATVAMAHQRALDAGNVDAKRIDRIEALDWITTAGAEALALENRIGRIEVGMQADVTFIDGRSLDLWPNNDPLATVLRSNASHVDTVLIAGEAVKRDKVSTASASTDLMERLAISAERILVDAGLKPVESA